MNNQRVFRVFVEEDYIGDAMYEANRRGAFIVSLERTPDQMVLTCEAPVDALAGYEDWLRQIAGPAARIEIAAESPC